MPDLTGIVDTSQTPYIREMRPGDVDWVLDLWRRQYGEPAEDTAEAAAADHPRVFGHVAMQGDRRAGFGIALVQEVKQLNRMYEVDFQPYVSHRQNGLVYQICIEPEFESRGHGTRLFRRGVWTLSGYDDGALRHAVACSWQRRDAHDSSAILEKLGFERVLECEQYYGDARPGCPDCEGQVCDCAAAFYVRRFAKSRREKGDA